jgi:hypothetical protein
MAHSRHSTRRHPQQTPAAAAGSPRQQLEGLASQIHQPQHIFFWCCFIVQESSCLQMVRRRHKYIVAKTRKNSRSISSFGPCLDPPRQNSARPGNADGGRLAGAAACAGLTCPGRPAAGRPAKAGGEPRPLHSAGCRARILRLWAALAGLGLRGSVPVPTAWSPPQPVLRCGPGSKCAAAAIGRRRTGCRRRQDGAIRPGPACIAGIRRARRVWTARSRARSRAFPRRHGARFGSPGR